MKCGDTFLFPLIPPDLEHLWIVLTNPDAEGCVLLANITGAYSNDKDRVDLTVGLNPGDHPFVTKAYYVFYREAMIKRVTELESEEKAGNLKMNQPCSESLLRLARSGVSASRHCSKKIRRFFDERKVL
jgi:hypothetical protein